MSYEPDNPHTHVSTNQPSKPGFQLRWGGNQRTSHCPIPQLWVDTFNGVLLIDDHWKKKAKGEQNIQAVAVNGNGDLNVTAGLLWECVVLLLVVLAQGWKGMNKIMRVASCFSAEVQEWSAQCVSIIFILLTKCFPCWSYILRLIMKYIWISTWFMCINLLVR